MTTMDRQDKESIRIHRYTMVVAVHLLLLHGDTLLLARRFNTGYEDGNYSLPAGHVEENESCLDAAVREAGEELGIVVKREDLSFAHAVHRKSDRESMDVFFSCRKWKGTPKVNEPDKCDRIFWCGFGSLPDNTVGYVRAAIAAYRKGDGYSEYGWIG